VALDLLAVQFGAADPSALAAFWAALLRRDVAQSPDGDVLVPPAGDAGPALRFTQKGAAKSRQNRIHLDLTSDSPDHQQALVERVLALGGRHVDVGQSADEDHVVLADREGNELCVIPPDNRFLAGCGRVGAVNCDGTSALGHFWSAALGWPLVWDQDEETAIQSPRGGSKLTWSGPPLMPRDGTTPIALEVVPAPGSDHATEVERLAALGATVTGERTAHGRWLLDPDGNRFLVRRRLEVSPPRSRPGAGP
jgi:hypothetical protein